MKRFLAALVALLFVACTTTPPEYRAATRDLLPTVVVLQSEAGKVFCSGVAVSEHVVLTNKHCTRTGLLHKVKTHDQQLFTAVVQYESETYDFALVRVPYAHLTAARVANSPVDVQQGDFVIAIGHPYAMEWTATFGHVDKAPFESDFEPGKWIGHTALLNPGNSGGPLFNASGELIGINTWGIVGSGLGYSLSIDTIILELTPA